MTETTATLSFEDAKSLVDATLGELGHHVPFATETVKPGDVAVVLRKEGGVQVLYVLDDNPNKDTIATLGVRGMFAMGIMHLLADRDLMASAVRIAHAKMSDAGKIPSLQ